MLGAYVRSAGDGGLRRVDGTLLVVHAPIAPAEQGWRDAMDLAAGLKAFGTSLVLVPPEFPGPSATQRKALAELFGAHPEWRCAVVTSSLLHRGMLTAMRWFMGDKQMVPFAPAAWREALQFICPARAKQPAICAVAAAMVKELGAETAFSRGPWSPSSVEVHHRRVRSLGRRGWLGCCG